MLDALAARSASPRLLRASHRHLKRGLTGLVVADNFDIR